LILIIAPGPIDKVVSTSRLLRQTSCCTYLLHFLIYLLLYIACAVKSSRRSASSLLLRKIISQQQNHIGNIVVFRELSLKLSACSAGNRINRFLIITALQSSLGSNHPRIGSLGTPSFGLSFHSDQDTPTIISHFRLAPHSGSLPRPTIVSETSTHQLAYDRYFIGAQL